MLRLQQPLDVRHTDATIDELHRRVGAAKAALGDRLFILGHHYQRDEIIQWADARGDSYRLSVLAQQRPEAEYIVFCGVHFMAESADILTGDHQQVILPDLNAGCSMADMADIDEVEEAWEALGRGHRHRPGRADHLHELGGEPEGVRRVATAAPCAPRPTRGRCSSGRWPRATRCSSSPTSTSAATPRVAMGYGLDDMRVWNPRFERGGLTEAECKDATFLLWRGPLLDPPALPAGAGRGVPGRAPRRSRGHPPREPARDVPARRRRRLHRLHHPVRRGRAGWVDDRDRHRAPPREPAGAGAPRQDDRVARPAHLPVLDDEPHRPPPPGVGARGARRGAGR